MIKRPVSTLELALLGLIAQTPRSGYGVRKAFTATPLSHYSASPGAIYPALRRLEKAGLLTGSIEGEGTLRPRRVYSVTAAGVQTLACRLALRVTREDVVWHMDDLLLRFALMSTSGTPDGTVHFLQQLAAELDAHGRELRDYLCRVGQTMSPTGRYAVEQGIGMYEATAKWAKRVLSELGPSAS
jgi:DNA-binding PadR family transcriptional regulator